MHFQTISVITSLLVASAAAIPPTIPAGHSGPPAGHSGPPKNLPPCKPGHFWPDPFDCHSFFECAAGGHPVRKTCGPGTAYCWEVGVCVHEKDSKCSLPEGFQAHEFPGAKGHGPPPSHGAAGKGPEAHAPVAEKHV